MPAVSPGTDACTVMMPGYGVARIASRISVAAGGIPEPQAPAETVMLTVLPTQSMMCCLMQYSFWTVLEGLPGK